LTDHAETGKADGTGYLPIYEHILIYCPSFIKEASFHNELRRQVTKQTNEPMNQ